MVPYMNCILLSAERRKTWSGSSNKMDPDFGVERNAETEDEYHSDANNNSYNTSEGPHKENSFFDVQDQGAYTKENDNYYSESMHYGKDSYRGDVYGNGQSHQEDSRYIDSNYNRNSYSDQPNFKI